nr:ribonuclease H-like domain, reverse transcriptase, RNA-dependent DNA polymerase [Tanacetum cinerariifolium]
IPISTTGPSRVLNDGEPSYPDDPLMPHLEDYDRCKSAFLYGTIDVEVYVTQPPSFVNPKFPNKVYKVVKAIYGSHQAPRTWYATLSTFLERNGYRRGATDKTLFIKQDKKDIILVQVYVDDIIFGSTKKSWCDEFEELMKNSDYAGANLDRKSTTRGCQFLGKRLISWQCKKHIIMATSTIEAEYVAAAYCCGQVLWIQNQLLDYRLRALIDGKRVVVTEDVVRQALLLDDADGVECLPNDEIFTKLTRMGYEKSPLKLMFYKAFFSAQWKFLIHNLVQCISAKRTAWNEFSCSMASAVICLATGRKFNFSKYIFDSMVRNVDSPTKFLMYP